MLFLIAYDIADPRRLRRVARRLERHALRCQKSVFVYRGDERGLQTVLDEAGSQMDLREDCLQAWRLAAGETPHGLLRGAGRRMAPAALVLADGRQLFVTEGQS